MILATYIVIAILVVVIMWLRLTDRCTANSRWWQRGAFRNERAGLGVIVSLAISLAALLFPRYEFWYHNQRVTTNVAVTVGRFEVTNDTLDIEPELLVDMSVFNLGNRPVTITDVSLRLQQDYPESTMARALRDSTDSQAAAPALDVIVSPGVALGIGAGTNRNPLGRRIVLPTKTLCDPFLIAPHTMTTRRFMFGGPLRSILDNSLAPGPVAASVHVECITSTDEYFLTEVFLGQVQRAPRIIKCVEHGLYPLRIALTEFPIAHEGRGPTMSMWIRSPYGCDIWRRGRDGTMVLMQIGPEDPRKPFGSVVRVESPASKVSDGTLDTMMVWHHTADGK